MNKVIFMDYCGPLDVYDIKVLVAKWLEEIKSSGVTSISVVNAEHSFSMQVMDENEVEEETDAIKGVETTGVFQPDQLHSGEEV